MQFYASDGAELLKFGGDNLLGKEETFGLAADEELLGCEIHHSKDDVILGITWLKWRPLKLKSYPC